MQSFKYENTYLAVEVFRRDRKFSLNGAHEFYATITSKSCYPREHVTLEESDLDELNAALATLKQS